MGPELSFGADNLRRWLITLSRRSNESYAHSVNGDDRRLMGTFSIKSETRVFETRLLDGFKGCVNAFQPPIKTT